MLTNGIWQPKSFLGFSSDGFSVLFLLLGRLNLLQPLAFHAFLLWTFFNNIVICLAMIFFAILGYFVLYSVVCVCFFFLFSLLLSSEFFFIVHEKWFYALQAIHYVLILWLKFIKTPLATDEWYKTNFKLFAHSLASACEKTSKFQKALKGSTTSSNEFLKYQCYGQMQFARCFDYRNRNEKHFL